MRSEVVRRYEPLVQAEANKRLGAALRSHKPTTRDDLVQAGRLALLEACAAGVNIERWAKRIVQRAIENEYGRTDRNDCGHRWEIDRFADDADEDEERDHRLGSPHPELDLIDAIDLAEALDNVAFTDRERAIYELLDLGHTQQEVADALGVTRRQVIRIVKGIRKKLALHVLGAEDIEPVRVKDWGDQ